MFKKILIANRGEIAVRVIRACREMKIIPVAVYSEADRKALHVRLAEEAYFIGEAKPSESYLHVEKIIATAKKCGAEAIHPGYGFLAENPRLVRRCEEEGITFIGPPSEPMEPRPAARLATVCVPGETFPSSTTRPLPSGSLERIAG